MALTRGIHHVAYRCRDANETVDFYKRALDMDLLLAISYAAEEGDAEEATLAKVNLGRRHDRLIGTLSAAVRAGFAKDPQTLQRRKRSGEYAPLSNEELALQDRLKADRDRVAAKVELEPTLIANRSQLALIARSPAKIDEILLPWQAELLRDEPSLKASLNGA